MSTITTTPQKISPKSGTNSLAAVAAITPSTTPAAPADAASGRGIEQQYLSKPYGRKVHGIEPVNGWVLHEEEYEDGDGFVTSNYYVERNEEVRYLGVCRFQFNPTQERFQWLADNNFPRGWGPGPVTDKIIDTELAGAA